MTYANILDDVISSLQPENLPSEYIIMAKVQDLYGVETILQGIELEKFLADPDSRYTYAEARVIINVQKIRLAIVTALTMFFDDLKEQIDALPPLIEGQ